MKNKLENDIKKIKKIFDSDDLITKELVIGNKNAALIFLDGLINKELLEENVIRPLKKVNVLSRPYKAKIESVIYYCEDLVCYDNTEELIESIASGDIGFLISGAESYFMLSIKKYNMRSVDEPPTETVLKGPREGFVEDFKTNLTLLRRRIKNPMLKIKFQKVGKYSKTPVAVIYIEGIAKKSMVDKITKKINEINIDGIIESTYVEKYIEDRKFSFFNQVGHDEKPDIVASKLLEGRIAILVDGSPIILTVPYIMFEAFQDSYDYYTRAARSTMLRSLRIISAFITVLLPALYVADLQFHYQLLPIKFLMTIMKSVAGIPFSAPVEVFFILILFEILYQASIRMPRYVGISLSVVGAIVLGDTAVSAGLISPPAVLVIAISAIGINCVPDYVDTFSLLRAIFLFIGSILGLYGIMLGFIAMITYLCAMQNYGAPYMAPHAPMIPSDLKDGIFKSNLTNMKTRPKSIPHNNNVRMKIGGKQK